MDNVDEIIQATFQYIQMMVKEGPKKWMFEEVATISEMAFRFKDKERPQSFVSGNYLLLKLEIK